MSVLPPDTTLIRPGPLGGYRANKDVRVKDIRAHVRRSPRIIVFSEGRDSPATLT